MAHHFINLFGFPTKVIALLDVDSFECQIYDRLYPAKKIMTKPAVVADRTGRIVSVTYPAKKIGISRDFRVDQARKFAKEQNVNLAVFYKHNDREKPDGKEVRYASWEILDSLTEFRYLSGWDFVIELSSCDEFFVDLTEEVNRRIDSGFPRSMVIGNRTFLELEDGPYSGENLRELVRFRYDNMLPQDVEELQHEKRLLLGALMMQEINSHVFTKTRLVASVGVGGNKLMAKMAVSINKPNGITAFPNGALARLGDLIGIEKIPGFGSVLGTKVKGTLKLGSMNELARTDLDELEDNFGNKGIEIYLKSKGILDEPVKEKLMNEEISCGKSYRRGQVNSFRALLKYFKLLIEEMLDRLDEEDERHGRYPIFLRFGILYASDSNEASSIADSTAGACACPGACACAGAGACGGATATTKANGNSKHWCCFTGYICDNTSDEYLEEVMYEFLDKNPFDIDKVEIKKMEVRAKNFEFF